MNRLRATWGSYVAVLLQHLHAVGQVWSHELWGVDFGPLSDFPSGQARLEVDKAKTVNFILDEQRKFYEFEGT